jgi:hypothetical protein
MGCAKGDDANATAKGGAVASEGRCDPEAECRRPNNAVAASPPLPDPCFPGPLGRHSGAPPFARSLPRQTACKAPSHPVAAKSGAHGVALLGIVVPATTCVARLPYDHPDFNSNALSEDLFSGSLNKLDRVVVFQDFLNIEPKLRLFCQKVFRHFLPKSF